MKLTLLFIPVLAVFLGNGCTIGGLPVPHTSRATPAIHARLIDEQTGKPIRGAILRIPERPKHSAVSDADGEVTLKPVRNMHWLIVWKGNEHTSLPDGFEWSWSQRVEIVHPNYQTVKVRIPSNDETKSVKLDAIKLVRKPQPDLTETHSPP